MVPLLRYFFAAYVEYNGLDSKWWKLIPSRTRRLLLLSRLSRPRKIELQEFVSKHVLPKIDDKMVWIVENFESDYKVLISASLEDYLIEACSQRALKFDRILGTRLQEVEGKFRDCNGEENVERLKLFLFEKCIFLLVIDQEGVII